MTRAFGIDESYAQENYNLQGHHDFIINRVAYGTLEDSWYRTHTKQTEGVPIRGVYQYLRSLSHLSANAHIDALLNITTGDRVDFYAIDFEKYYNKASYAFSEMARECCYKIMDLTGKVCFLYSNPDTIQSWMFQYGSYWVRDYPYLWIAQWPYNGWNSKLDTVPTDLSWNPRLPAGCTKWGLWQYAGNGNGQGAKNGVDSRDALLDVFNGTVDQMRAYLNLEELPPITGDCDKEYDEGWTNAIYEIQTHLNNMKEA